MRDYCEKQQRGAQDEVGTLDLSNEISMICASKWPEDWHMFSYCAKQQKTADTPAAALPLEPTGKIQDYCRREWANNYSMREDCERRQSDARAELRGHNIDDEIARHCAAEWSDNWAMFKDCVERQSDSKSRL